MSFYGSSDPGNVFYDTNETYLNVPGNATQTRNRTKFDISRQVETGPDNAPTNLSTRYWRRVA
jgi:hypothetical protein